MHTQKGVRKFHTDSLEVRVFNDRKELGEGAAGSVAEEIQRLMRERERVRMVFAAAPSQNEFLSSFVRMNIAWERITAFHMDEYIGLEADADQRFGNYLRKRLFEKVPIGTVHYIEPDDSDDEDVCGRYTDLLREAPIDIVCMGIGENGHIAFNDPPVADFNDPRTVKIVELDETCRMQQVHDGCFGSLAEVPTRAVTLTVPTLMSARFLSVVVPGKTKSDAVEKTVLGPISETCPASILRTHPRAILFLDKDSAVKLV
jgi:glucosamine-6-phosphate deaminase